MFPLRQKTLSAPKRFFFLTFSVLLTNATAGFAQEKQARPETANLQIIQSWGWMVAQDKNVAGIELNEAELVLFLKGVSENFSNLPAPVNMQKAFPNLEHLAHARRTKHMRAITARNEAAAKEFFVSLKKNTNVVELPNGLCYEILKRGDGTFPKPTQTVNIHYLGHLTDGTEFAEFGPLDHILVTNHPVCRGWVDAMQKLDRGGRMKLCVPPPFSEAEAIPLGLQPGVARVYDVELFAIKDTSPDDLANATLPPAPESEPPLSDSFNSPQLIQAWGWSVVQQTGAAKFNFNSDQIAAFTKGLLAGIKEQPAPNDWTAIGPRVDRFVAEARAKVRATELQKRRDEADRFFTALKANTNVVQLPDGLRFEILRPGSGAFPKRGQIVVVNYTGRLIDGTVFDRTDNEPLNIEVGSVTPGFNEGIQKINKGGKIKLYIPSALGFSDVTVSSVISAIPAGSTLLYEIELLDIKDSLPGN
jgi:FKBP-type peptidyl-prolyl cis-trans isomerase